MSTPADLPAILLARACLAAGVPLTLLLDLAADEIDSAEIFAVEQVTAMAARERAITNQGKRNSEIA
ncbi:MAG: hypothetical protein QOG53_1249 [Frankiales bacterium]|jgi:hypothetical protein|nr:hypothetical protein [Frankiales bacterium]